MKRQWVERCLTAACAVGIFFLCLLNYPAISGPVMMNDELGYLANAAALAGKDWHSVMEHCAWYGYGWSLVLVPLFYLFSSMPAILKGVNVINAAAVVATFFMQRSLLKRLFKDERPFLATIASAGACCYVAVLTQAELFMSETWLMFVYTLITLLVQRLAERPSKKRLVAFGVLLDYLYICHNRMLALVIAAVIIVAALYARRRIRIRDVLLFIASLAVAHIAFGRLKAYIVSVNWSGVAPQGNTLKNMLQNLLGIGRGGLIRNFFISVVTHVFSVCLASYGLVPFGLFMCAKRTVDMLRKGTKGSDEPLLEAWMALSFLGLFAVTILTQIDSYIFDYGYKYLFYTRYLDPVCVLLIAYGFRALAEEAPKRWAARYSLAYTCLFAALAVTAYIICARVYNSEFLYNDSFVKPNSSGIAFYLFRMDYRPVAVLAAGLCGAIGWNVIRLLFKGGKAWKLIAVAGFIAVNLKLLCATYGDAYMGQLYFGQDLALVDVVQSADTQDLPVYVVSGDSDIGRFQCWLMDTTLQYAEGLPADQIPEERYYAIVSREAFETLGYREAGGEILGETQRHLFLRVGGQP